MLSSRGLRLLPNSPKCLGKRQFSSTIILPTKSRPAPLLSNPTISLAKSNNRPRILNTAPVVLLNGSILRFQSTTPSSPQGTLAVPSPPPTAITTPQSEFITEPAAESTFVFQTPELVDVPETIGYLKSLGLDYGWGPTAVVEWMLEHVHVLAGTPWWASIAITAVLVRVGLYKLFKEASNNASRVGELRPLTDPITKRMQDSLASGDKQAAIHAKKQLSAINQKAGVKVSYGLVAPLLQGFIGYGTFHLMRGMGALPVPGWESGGILWFTNLAIPDPFYLLPLGASAILYFNLNRVSTAGTGSLMSPSTMRTIAIVLPVLSLAFLSFVPSGLQLSFLISGFMSSVQGWAFAQPNIRAKLGMEPLPPDHGPSGLFKSLFNEKTDTQQTNTSASTVRRAPQVQKRVVLASKHLTHSSLKYEAPTRTSISARNRNEEAKKPERKSVIDSLKGGFNSKLEDLRATAKAAQGNWATTPEQEEKKEAERYEKRRREEIQAEKERRRESRGMRNIR